MAEKIDVHFLAPKHQPQQTRRDAQAMPENARRESLVALWPSSLLPLELRQHDHQTYTRFEQGFRFSRKKC